MEQPKDLSKALEVLKKIKQNAILESCHHSRSEQCQEIIVAVDTVTEFCMDVLYALLPKEAKEERTGGNE